MLDAIFLVNQFSWLHAGYNYCINDIVQLLGPCLGGKQDYYYFR